jgi:hypothetical protein
LDARHRMKTNKTKQKQKQNKNATQNMRKGWATQTH